MYYPVFIIGAPRTGSTILYQIMTNLYDILYINNDICVQHRNNLLDNFKKFGSKAHNNYFSNYGNTMKYGEKSPSECGAFWYRWLPLEKHFIDFNEINIETIREIRKEVISVIEYFNKNFIFKNLPSGQRIRFLTQCFPEAKYIFIKRDIQYIIQDIILCRKKLNISDKEWWSVKPKNFEELNKLPLYEKIYQQVINIEKQIYEDSKLILKNNFFIVKYEELSINMIEDLANKFNLIKRNEIIMAPLIFNDNKQILNNEEFQRIKDVVNYYEQRKI